MIDKQLIANAAKAAGIVLVPYTWNKGAGWGHEGFTVAGEGPNEWNPLESDEAAFRLAVRLRLKVEAGYLSANVRPNADEAEALGLDDDGVTEVVHEDACEATRRAIRSPVQPRAYRAAGRRSTAIASA